MNATSSASTPRAHALCSAICNRSRAASQTPKRASLAPNSRSSPSSLKNSPELRRRSPERERCSSSNSSSTTGSHPASANLNARWKAAPRTSSVTLRQVPQPDHSIIHAPQACHQCDASVEHAPPQHIIRRQVFDIEDGWVKVTEHRSEAKLCPECGTLTRAALLASVRAPAQYGSGVLSRCVYLHHYQLLPVARTSETMRDLFGCSHRLVKRDAKLNPRPDIARRGPPRGRPPSLPTPRTIVHRLRRKRDEVLCFMRDISVPFDNNGSERDLRMVKLQQKISGCFRTDAGARSFCRVRSYISTARKQGHPLLRALERVLAGKPLPLETAPT